MSKEQTLSIIKPDAVANNLIGAIYKMIEDHSLFIIAAKMVWLNRDQAKQLYITHKDRIFFDDLIEFMTSGPIMVQVLEGEDAVARYRKLMGATKPEEAAEGTVRYRFAVNNPATRVQENAVHGSDSPENAAMEISFFFKQEEIYPKNRSKNGCRKE